jgi:hypothetical protein
LTGISKEKIQAIAWLSALSSAQEKHKIRLKYKFIKWIILLLRMKTRIIRDMELKWTTRQNGYRSQEWRL